MGDYAPINVASYPRDDVRWVKDGKERSGVATVLRREDDGELTQVGEVELGDFHGVLSIPAPPGQQFLVRLHGEYDGRVYEREVVFTATEDEDDVYVSAVGPGAHPEKGSGMFAKTRYSGFEFGVLVIMATTDQGSDAYGAGSLVDHGPGDGIGDRWAVAGS
jgi:hypothetical protein